MLPISAGDLVSAGVYKLHSRFSRAVNYLAADKLVSLVPPEIGEGPLNLVFENFSPSEPGDELLISPPQSPQKSQPPFPYCHYGVTAPLAETASPAPIPPCHCEERSPKPYGLGRSTCQAHPAASTHSGDEAISQLGKGTDGLLRPNYGPQTAPEACGRHGTLAMTKYENRISLSGVPVYDSSLEISPQDWRNFRLHLPLLRRLLVSKSPAESLAFLCGGKSVSSGFEGEFVRAAQNAASLFCAGRFGAGAAKFKGLGRGLTPSGDDFLSGYLLALNLIEKGTGKKLNKIRQSVYAAALGKNPLSNAFLSCARDGRFSAGLKKLVLASADGEKGVEGLVREVLASGATSGADTLSGFIFALEVHDGG